MGLECLVRLICIILKEKAIDERQRSERTWASREWQRSERTWACRVAAHCIRLNYTQNFILKWKQDARRQIIFINFIFYILYCTFYKRLPTAYEYIVIYSGIYILPLPGTMLYILH